MKTYTVLAEGWLTNARGHGAHYVPAAEGEKPVTIELLPAQAEYLIASGQIGDPDAPKAEPAPATVPGETPGHPADAVTGEALALTDAERDRLSGTRIGDVDPDAPMVLGESMVQVAADQPEPASADAAAARAKRPR